MRAIRSQLKGEPRSIELPSVKIASINLIDYIAKHHNCSVSDFARANGYHLTQVQRHLEKGAYIEDGRVYFKKYLNKRGSNE